MLVVRVPREAASRIEVVEVEGAVLPRVDMVSPTVFINNLFRDPYAEWRLDLASLSVVQYAAIDEQVKRNNWSRVRAANAAIVRLHEFAERIDGLEGMQATIEKARQLSQLVKVQYCSNPEEVEAEVLRRAEEMRLHEAMMNSMRWKLILCWIIPSLIVVAILWFVCFR